MSEKSDVQLLRDYAQTGNEGAFRELVVRHTDLVYSAAARQVGSFDLAHDVAQTVFTDLARKARSLASPRQGGDSLVGWLYQATRFAALTQLRQDRRRHTRERQIMEEFEQPSAHDWDRIRPMLDEAMAELSDEDREAVLLRFFKERDFRSIGASLGISDDAAQKRVSRAIEKLREQFSRHGVTTTAVALSSAISANAVQIAPAGLAASLSSTALAGASVSTAAAVSQTVAMTTVHKSLIAATLAIVAGAGLYEARQASRLGAEAESLRRQQSPLTQRLQQWEHERDDLTNRLALLAAENTTLQSNSAELPKLRGEVARLRRDSQSQSSKSDGSPDFADAANSWVNRVMQLKQRLAQTPGASIPELQYVTEQDWLNAARGALNSDEDYRRALSTLRGAGESVFSSMLQKALKNYQRANQNQMPTDIVQLQSYFDAPVNEAALQRWQIAPARTVQSLGLGGDVIITQREAVDDVFDTRYGIGPSGRGSTDFLSREVAKTMDPVWDAYRKDHDGQWPDDVSQLQPYASTPDQQTALQKLVLKNSSGK